MFILFHSDETIGANTVQRWRAVSFSAPHQKTIGKDEKKRVRMTNWPNNDNSNNTCAYGRARMSNDEVFCHSPPCRASRRGQRGEMKNADEDEEHVAHFSGGEPKTERERPRKRLLFLYFTTSPRKKNAPSTRRKRRLISIRLCAAQTQRECFVWCAHVIADRQNFPLSSFPSGTSYRAQSNRCEFIMRALVCFFSVYFIFTFSIVSSRKIAHSQLGELLRFKKKKQKKRKIVKFVSLGNSNFFLSARYCGAVKNRRAIADDRATKPADKEIIQRYWIFFLVNKTLSVLYSSCQASLKNFERTKTRSSGKVRYQKPFFLF